MRAEGTSYPEFPLPYGIPRLSSPTRALEFRDLPRDQIRDYFLWFTSRLKERVEILTSQVRADPSFGEWKPDYRFGSLHDLGRWFRTRSRFRGRTARELLELEARFPALAPISEEALTLETFAVAADVGIYLGEALRYRHPTLRWEPVLRAKKSVDYGQPVLFGFPHSHMNPVEIAIIAAMKLARGEGEDSILTDRFTLWSSLMPDHG
jgi:hypothetical protein